MGKVSKSQSVGRKVLAQHEGEKPTAERSRGGVYEIVEGEVFDTERKGERVLVDWRSRAGGAGEMHTRGQIGLRELRAAVLLCELYEGAQRGTVSGGRFTEYVDGGEVDIDGHRLLAAASAAGGYHGAMMALPTVTRFLVERRVVLALPMEEVVRMQGVAHRLGECAEDRTVRRQCDRAIALVAEGLDQLADLLGVRKG